MSLKFCVVLYFWLIPAILVFAQDNKSNLPTLSLNGSVDEVDNFSKFSINAEAVYSNLKPGKACFYVAYNDINYSDRRGAGRQLEVFGSPGQRLPTLFGMSTIRVKGAGQIQESPSAALLIVNIPAGSNSLTLHFTARRPHLPGEAGNQHFFDAWYPQLLVDCNIEEPEYLYLKPAQNVDTMIDLKVPGQFIVASAISGTKSSSLNGRLVTSNLAFALLKDAKIKSVIVGKQPINFIYSSDAFLELQPTVEQAVGYFQEWFGDYPFPVLNVVETRELQNLQLPGIISLNQPRQALFRSLQNDWINWRHWMIIRSISSQWFGVSLTVRQTRDLWFLEGFSEYATLSFLKVHTKRNNLFNMSDGGFHFLTFDYLQVSDIMSAMLEREAPFTLLTDHELKTHLPYDEQHALLFLRHSNALRQVGGFAGDIAFRSYIRSFYANFQSSAIDPKQFIDFFHRLPSPFAPQKRQRLAEMMTQWWTKEGWPDFAIANEEVTPLSERKWLVKTTIEQLGSIDFPPLISVKAEDGSLVSVRSQANPIKDAEAPWLAELVINSKPEEILIDRTHESYDRNRFNNTTNLPSIKFWPGGAKTLPSDGYTVLWFPYFSKRPGESPSIGLASAIFKYITPSLFVRAEYAPSSQDTQYSIQSRSLSGKFATKLDMRVEKTFENGQKIEGSISRDPLLRVGPKIGLSLGLRHKLTLGQKDTKHGTYVANINIAPSHRTRVCAMQANSEYERAPQGWSQGFWYERKFGITTINCNMFERMDLTLRLFAGRLSYGGDPPITTLFKPNELREARLRIDQSDLTRTAEIGTTNVDLLFPLWLPLPDNLMILARQLKLRLFYDYGRDYVNNFRYFSAGSGLFIPLGGDLSSVGSITLSRMSLLVIMYSRKDNDIKRKPSVLFDVTGQL